VYLVATSQQGCSVRGGVTGFWHRAGDGLADRSYKPAMMDDRDEAPLSSIAEIALEHLGLAPKDGQMSSAAKT